MNLYHLHINLAQLVFEKLATGSHHHFVHIDMMVLRIQMKFLRRKNVTLKYKHNVLQNSSCIEVLQIFFKQC